MANFRTLKWILFTLLAVAGVFLAQTPFSQEDSDYHSPAEMHHFENLGIDDEDHPIFLHSSECSGCHGFDPAGIASVDTFGNDINIFDDWRASMLGLSAVDPYWKAKVAHETWLFPNQKEDIEETCLKCHAPMGHYEAFFNGDNYLMEDFHGDSLGMDGVSCMSCHSIDSKNLGQGFNGDLTLDTNRVAYGPYPSPFEGPMTTFVGVEPKYSFHVFDAGMCADCHTLVTKSIGVDGNYTGETFVEQATYHEWLNSVYAQTGVTCQQCHMEQLMQPIVIASGINGLPPRNFIYRKHGFSGPNKQMLQAIQQNLNYLGLDIPDSLFDESISRSEELLGQRTADLKLSAHQNEDQILIDLNIQNKAGHKFPSGYPARRAYVEFIVESSSGDTLFHSGKRKNHRLVQTDTPYEIHHDTITAEDQVQIYQMVVEDNAGQVTSSLTGAYATVKDNRIPPEGFSTNSSVYDTTKIVGEALFDGNFNLDSIGEEGTGADQITMKLNMQDFLNRGFNTLNISTNLWYESIPQEDLEGIFSAGLPSSDTLGRVLEGNYFPVLVASTKLDNIVISSHTTTAELSKKPHLYPNPCTNKLFIGQIRASEVSDILAISSAGQLTQLPFSAIDDNELSLNTERLKVGAYFLHLEMRNGQHFALRFIKQQ